MSSSRRVEPYIIITYIDLYRRNWYPLTIEIWWSLLEIIHSYFYFAIHLREDPEHTQLETTPPHLHLRPRGKARLVG